MDLTGKKVLHLSLKKEPFEVMVTGEKDVEFRKRTDWLKSRLFDKQLHVKKYDVIKFVNGYGNDKPYFICLPDKGDCFFDYAKTDYTRYYSNGLTVEIKQGDCRIWLGEILETGNLKQNTSHQ